VDRAWLLNRLERLVTAESEPNVLIVDNDEISRYLLRSALAGFSVDITEANSGLEAIGAIEARRPRLIFLDLVMPELSGLELLERLDTSELSDIPVVISTSKVLSDLEVNALKQRVLDVIPKNITRDALMRRVREALQTARVVAGSFQERL
jgi:CheY-like chemotaxis protein